MIETGSYRMGINSCTDCQSGSIAAFEAYQQAALDKKDALKNPGAPSVDGQVAKGGAAALENRPIPGAVVGSTINLSA
jgi:hypothetical protein